MCVALKRWVKISYSIDFTISKMLFLPLAVEAIWMVVESVCFYEAVTKLDVIILPDKILYYFHFYVFIW